MGKILYEMTLEEINAIIAKRGRKRRANQAEYDRRWKAKNREKVRENDRAYRARKRALDKVAT